MTHKRCENRCEHVGIFESRLESLKDILLAVVGADQVFSSHGQLHQTHG